jgi:uncharacterized membrane protein YvlD (DUF360 family)
MIALLVSWALSATALLLSSRLFKGVQLKGDFLDALWIAAIYAILSFFLSWFIFGVLGVVTLGLGFLFHFVTQLVTAAIVLKVTAGLSSRFDILGFLPALGTAILLALASEAASRLLSL